MGLKLILKFVSVSLDFSLSFHHEEGRGGGAADEEGHAPCDEGDEGREREREGDEGHEDREREREGDEGDEGDEGCERVREGDEGDEGHEVSWRGVIGAWAWLRRVVVSTSLLSVGQKMQLNLSDRGRTRVC